MATLLACCFASSSLRDLIAGCASTVECTAAPIAAAAATGSYTGHLEDANIFFLGDLVIGLTIAMECTTAAVAAAVGASGSYTGGLKEAELGWLASQATSPYKSVTKFVKVLSVFACDSAQSLATLGPG